MRREARFLLHVWCDTERGDAWRARLEELATREVKLFGDLEALNDYLQSEMNLRLWQDDDGGTPATDA